LCRSRGTDRVHFADLQPRNVDDVNIDDHHHNATTVAHHPDHVDAVQR
jgi:hypothetical protein